MYNDPTNEILSPPKKNHKNILYLLPIQIGRAKKKDVENKTWILYNDTVLQFLKRDVAQLGSAFVLGTKCHRFKSCHPYLSTVTRDSLSKIGKFWT